MQDDLKNKLMLTLKGLGFANSTTLLNSLGVSQPTLSRLVQRSHEVIGSIGKGKSTQYFLKRSGVELNEPIPVFLVDEKADVKSVGQLTLIENRGCIFESNFQDSGKKNVSEIFPGIPYFLNDVLPQGFLGKVLISKFPELSLPLRLEQWNENDYWRYLCNRGEDLPGNLIIGRTSFERFQNQQFTEFVDANKKSASYEKLACDVLAGIGQVSSAGGEQPKFLCTVKSKRKLNPVLVKFSPPLKTEVGQRWADLLICESIALETVSKLGIAVSETKIIQTNNRLFLEVTRFDRVESKNNKIGRKNVISLESIDNQWFGKKDNWVLAAQRMVKGKMLSLDDFKKIKLFYCFSQLIGNTDCHFGNLSFFIKNDMCRKPYFELAPAYDVLPMFYAPIGQQIVDRVYKPPTSQPETLFEWDAAKNLALEFWSKVSKSKAVSKSFRNLATKHQNLDIFK